MKNSMDNLEEVNIIEMNGYHTSEQSLYEISECWKVLRAVYFGSAKLEPKWYLDKISILDKEDEKYRHDLELKIRKIIYTLVQYFKMNISHSLNGNFKKYKDDFESFFNIKDIEELRNIPPMLSRGHVQLKNDTQLIELKSVVNACYNKYNEYQKELNNIWQFIPVKGMIFDKIIAKRIYEAIDQYSLGYYRSALIVVGVTIEEMFRKIGKKRKIGQIEIEIWFKDKNGLPQTRIEKKKWSELNFNEMNKVLNKSPISSRGEVIIKGSLKKDIESIISKRNMCVHSTDDVEIKKIMANKLAYMNIGIRILYELCDILNKIPKFSKKLTLKIKEEI